MHFRCRLWILRLRLEAKGASAHPTEPGHMWPCL